VCVCVCVCVCFSANIYSVSISLFPHRSSQTPPANSSTLINSNEVNVSLEVSVSKVQNKRRVLINTECVSVLSSAMCLIDCVGKARQV